MTIEILDQLNVMKIDHVTKKIVQDQKKAKNGKYTYVKRTKDENGIDYHVTEYVCPNGEVGFDIVFYATIDGKEYVKSVCYGAEAGDRMNDWMEIINEGI